MPEAQQTKGRMEGDRVEQPGRGQTKQGLGAAGKGLELSTGYKASPTSS